MTRPIHSIIGMLFLHHLGELSSHHQCHRYMDYTVVREDASQPLQSCTDAFNDIISQCITGGNYWGGTWSLNGFSYSIYNSIYDQNPNNPLGPNDAGGPSASPANPPANGTPNSGSNPNPNPAAPVPGQTIITEVDPQGSTVVETVRRPSDYLRKERANAGESSSCQPLFLSTQL
jgi:hypothetical protein